MIESLSALLERDITPEPARPRPPTMQAVASPLAASGTATSPAAFETAVFNFLLAHKQPLGIDTVWRCRNARVDGLLDLMDGRRVAIEVKYRMNWEKACQACAQFGWYRISIEPQEKELAGALIFFEEFTADWARRKKSSLLENGWSYFYTDHKQVEGLRVDLLRLRGGQLESMPSALDQARSLLSAGGTARP